MRYVVHRAFLGSDSLRPLLVSSTDVRSPKVAQLQQQSSNPLTEVAWWIEGAGEQYRIVSRAYVLPSPKHPLYAQFPFDRLTPSSAASSQTAAGESSELHKDSDDENTTLAQWWEKERIATFNDRMGGALRASWCRPTPGSDLPGGYDSAKEWLERLPRSSDVQPGSKEEADVRYALENFALLVLEPVRVERVELHVVSRPSLLSRRHSSMRARSESRI